MRCRAFSAQPSYCTRFQTVVPQLLYHMTTTCHAHAFATAFEFHLTEVYRLPCKVALRLTCAILPAAHLSAGLRAEPQGQPKSQSAKARQLHIVVAGLPPEWHVTTASARCHTHVPTRRYLCYPAGARPQRTEVHGTCTAAATTSHGRIIRRRCAYQKMLRHRRFLVHCIRTAS